MKKYKYLIVGGGMTADSAVHGIREVDRDGEVGLLGDETEPPYNRPLLSKGLWKNKTVKDIWRGTEACGVDLLLGRRAVALDATTKLVTDDRGEVYAFDKLLLATGGTPRRLHSDDTGVLYYRTLQDYRGLRAMTEQKQRFAVIGGGFIGSEIAAALAMNGKSVVMGFLESGLCGRIFPVEISHFLNRYYQEKGVRLFSGRGLAKLERVGEAFTVRLEDGTTFTVDGVIAGLGIVPNLELAAQAGLAVDSGIVVDGLLRTTNPDIFAAGDVASFFNPALNLRLRVEHEDNANTMGKRAGRNMAGEEEPYDHLPFFYSDLFDHGYEAVGQTDPSLETFVHWEEPNRKGAVFYLNNGCVRGVLLWNNFGKVDEARKLISTPGSGNAAALQAWYREKVQRG